MVRHRFDILRALALLLATLIGLTVCYLVALPFLPALVWALTAAVLAMPLHRRLEKRVKRPNLAAGMSLGIFALLVFVPLMLLGSGLLTALGTGLSSLQEHLASGELQRFAESHPLIGRMISLVPGQADLSAISGNVAEWLTGLGASIVKVSVANVLTVLLTFYILFYFLRDHREALRQARRLLPLTDSETNNLFGRVSDTIFAVVFGTVVAAAAQGALGFAIFWILGLPNPVFWGMVMAMLAIVPVLGAFVVWVPAALYLAITGDWGKAAILTAWGGVVIGGIDNILHPVLAGGRLRLHTIPTFIAIVGGLALFGAAGLILGPLAVTLTLAMLEIWRERANAADDGASPYTGQGSE
jgi:predicted PurR-regulated permease PerM